MKKICVKFISKCSECHHCKNTYRGIFHECGLTNERIYCIFNIPESCTLKDIKDEDADLMD